MNLLGELDLVMLLFSERIMVHYNFVQVLVFKIYKRYKLTPIEMKPLPLVLECHYLSTIKFSCPASSLTEEPNKVGFTQKGIT